MRKMNEENDRRILQVTCNKCGKHLRVQNGVLTEECCSVAHSFGYFSQKDGIRHRFDLCESCYDKFVASFVIPVEESEVTEILGAGDFLYADEWNEIED